ncbi:2-dehydropantoate 2-reductase [Desulfomarina profundi]|uniref:2-dehydropantoate 2-reductase n=1 Tax=Desulfomarina profundi TaxID=2772557 RepID=A0A8D5JKI3_9BACT|nr:2-dehydropantoate 2-reductase [Desulfomarina profundi]BCL59572.1 2-dehydropantoate 2-reductase [Desulfomarina profundi]
MHFLIAGPGALGCLLFSKLFRGIRGTAHTLGLLDYNGRRAEALSRSGILYYLGDNKYAVPTDVAAVPQAATPADVIVFCVKSYDLRNSLDYWNPLINEKTLLIFMQNGIAHLDLGTHLHDGTVAYGTTTEGATLLAPGQVRHAGSGRTFLGFPQSVENHFLDLLEKTKTCFENGGLQTDVTDQIMTRLWSKLFINVGINALTATLNCRNGELLSLAGVRDRMKTAVDEAVEIARRLQIDIIEDPYRTTLLVAEKTADNISSMLQDVRNCKKTEIDAINGAIEKAGKKLHIPTPENSRLTREIKSIEENYPQYP